MRSKDLEAKLCPRVTTISLLIPKTHKREEIIMPPPRKGYVGSDASGDGGLNEVKRRTEFFRVREMIIVPQHTGGV